MAPKEMTNVNSPVVHRVTIDDLSRRFLDSKVEQAIPEIDVPEIEMELQGLKMKMNVEKLNLDFQLNNLSGHILVVGFYATLVGLVGGLYRLLF